MKIFVAKASLDAFFGGCSAFPPSILPQFTVDNAKLTHTVCGAVFAEGFKYQSGPLSGWDTAMPNVDDLKASALFHYRIE